ncbi:DUF6994 family protein [Anaerolentibacter hominis]|uniref:DUF6994 family protein n=1 Tax=Anaerolentibacter hominis TaxID=3079009 RepID=UPI0031B8400B
MDKIDISFDFTTDTSDYWLGFWDRNNGLGAGGNDPDAFSKTLQKYHQILWSKKLPNGEYMDLSMGTGSRYLTWKDFRFGSDSITASFRYNKYREMMEQVKQARPDYKSYMENYLHRSYTIGGAIIFPKRIGGINQSRGCNPFIMDRWDLSLECIRRYYLGEVSPLYDVLQKDKGFFDLFMDFKGYVDFFYLQDCVSSDYSEVKLWLGEPAFTYSPLPKTVDSYFSWIESNLNFVEKRNKRIQSACQSKD